MLVSFARIEETHFVRGIKRDVLDLDKAEAFLQNSIHENNNSILRYIISAALSFAWGPEGERGGPATGRWLSRWQHGGGTKCVA